MSPYTVKHVDQSEVVMTVSLEATDSLGYESFAPTTIDVEYGTSEELVEATGIPEIRPIESSHSEADHLEYEKLPSPALEGYEFVSSEIYKETVVEKVAEPIVEMVPSPEREKSPSPAKEKAVLEKEPSPVKEKSPSPAKEVEPSEKEEVAALPVVAKEPSPVKEKSPSPVSEAFVEMAAEAVLEKVPSPQREKSPSSAKEEAVVEKEPSPVKEKSPSPVREAVVEKVAEAIVEKVPSPEHEKSPSPAKEEAIVEKEPSPVKEKSPSPAKEVEPSEKEEVAVLPILAKEPSPVKEKSPSPVREAVVEKVAEAIVEKVPSSEREKSPSPAKEEAVVEKEPSPVKEKSPSPVREAVVEKIAEAIVEKVPSPKREKSPSPAEEETVLEKEPSPVKEKSPSPAKEVEPSEKEEVAALPVVAMEPSPVKEKSPSPVREAVVEKVAEAIVEKVPSPEREKSPSPAKEEAVVEKERSPVKEKSPSPAKEVEPSEKEEVAVLPILAKEPSPVKEKSPSPVREAVVEKVAEAIVEKVPSSEREKSPSPAKEEAVVEKEPSPVKEKSPSPVREAVVEKIAEAIVEKVPSPKREKSPSPAEEEAVLEKEPSPVKEKSPSPAKEVEPSEKEEVAALPVVAMEPSPVKEKSPSPVREAVVEKVAEAIVEKVPSPEREKSPSPAKEEAVVEKEPSPVKEKSPSPVREAVVEKIAEAIVEKVPSPEREKSPSPAKEEAVVEKEPSPVKEKSPSPAKEVEPSEKEEVAVLPILAKEPSPVKEKSPSPVREAVVEKVAEAIVEKVPSSEREKSPSPAKEEAVVEKEASPVKEKSPSPVREAVVEKVAEAIVEKVPSPEREKSPSPAKEEAVVEKEPSPVKEKSPSPVREAVVEKIAEAIVEKVPSPKREKSPSPAKEEAVIEKEPSPVKEKSPSPAKEVEPSEKEDVAALPVVAKEPSPVKEKSPSPVREAVVEKVAEAIVEKVPSPEREKSPSPAKEEAVVEKEPSPVKEKSPSPVREAVVEKVAEAIVEKVPSPEREKSPSPAKEEAVLEKEPSPVKEKSPSPAKEVEPSEKEEVAALPVVAMEPSPVKEKSPSPVREAVVEKVAEAIVEKVPCPEREKSPSPAKEEAVVEKEPSPVKEKSPSPPKEVEPSEKEEVAALAVVAKEPSPVKEKSPSPVREAVVEKVAEAIVEKVPSPEREKSPSPAKEEAVVVMSPYSIDSLGYETFAPTTLDLEIDTSEELIEATDIPEMQPIESSRSDIDQRKYEKLPSPALEADESVSSEMYDVFSVSPPKHTKMVFPDEVSYSGKQGKHTSPAEEALPGLEHSKISPSMISSDHIASPADEVSDDLEETIKTVSVPSPAEEICELPILPDIQKDDYATKSLPSSFVERHFERSIEKIESFSEVSKIIEHSSITVGDPVEHSLKESPQQYDDDSQHIHSRSSQSPDAVEGLSVDDKEVLYGYEEGEAAVEKADVSEGEEVTESDSEKDKSLKMDPEDMVHELSPPMISTSMGVSDTTTAVVAGVSISPHHSKDEPTYRCIDRVVEILLPGGDRVDLPKSPLHIDRVEETITEEWLDEVVFQEEQISHHSMPKLEPESEPKLESVISTVTHETQTYARVSVKEVGTCTSESTVMSEQKGDEKLQAEEAAVLEVPIPERKQKHKWEKLPSPAGEAPEAVLEEKLTEPEFLEPREVLEIAMGDDSRSQTCEPESDEDTSAASSADTKESELDDDRSENEPEPDESLSEDIDGKPALHAAIAAATLGLQAGAIAFSEETCLDDGAGDSMQVSYELESESESLEPELKELRSEADDTHIESEQLVKSFSDTTEHALCGSLDEIDEAAIGKIQPIQQPETLTMRPSCAELVPEISPVLSEEVLGTEPVVETCISFTPDTKPLIDGEPIKKVSEKKSTVSEDVESAIDLVAGDEKESTSVVLEDVKPTATEAVVKSPRDGVVDESIQEPPLHMCADSQIEAASQELSDGTVAEEKEQVSETSEIQSDLRDASEAASKVPFIFTRTDTPEIAIQPTDEAGESPEPGLNVAPPVSPSSLKSPSSGADDETLSDSSVEDDVVIEYDTETGSKTKAPIIGDIPQTQLLSIDEVEEPASKSESISESTQLDVLDPKDDISEAPSQEPESEHELEKDPDTKQDELEPKDLTPDRSEDKHDVDKADISVKVTLSKTSPAGEELASGDEADVSEIEEQILQDIESDVSERFKLPQASDLDEGDSDELSENDSLEEVPIKKIYVSKAYKEFSTEVVEITTEVFSQKIEEENICGGATAEEIHMESQSDDLVEEDVVISTSAAPAHHAHMDSVIASLPYGEAWTAATIKQSSDSDASEPMHTTPSTGEAVVEGSSSGEEVDEDFVIPALADKRLHAVVFPSILNAPEMGTDEDVEVEEGVITSTSAAPDHHAHVDVAIASLPYGETWTAATKASSDSDASEPIHTTPGTGEAVVDRSSSGEEADEDFVIPTLADKRLHAGALPSILNAPEMGADEDVEVEEDVITSTSAAPDHHAHVDVAIASLPYGETWTAATKASSDSDASEPIHTTPGTGEAVVERSSSGEEADEDFVIPALADKRLHAGAFPSILTAPDTGTEADISEDEDTEKSLVQVTIDKDDYMVTSVDSLAEKDDMVTSIDSLAEQDMAESQDSLDEKVDMTTSIDSLAEKDDLVTSVDSLTEKPDFMTSMDSLEKISIVVTPDEHGVDLNKRLEEQESLTRHFKQQQQQQQQQQDTMEESFEDSLSDIPPPEMFESSTSAASVDTYVGSVFSEPEKYRTEAMHESFSGMSGMDDSFTSGTPIDDRETMAVSEESDDEYTEPLQEMGASYEEEYGEELEFQEAKDDFDNVKFKEGRSDTIKLAETFDVSSRTDKVDPSVDTSKSAEHEKIHGTKKENRLEKKTEETATTFEETYDILTETEAKDFYVQLSEQAAVAAFTTEMAHTKQEDNLPEKKSDDASGPQGLKSPEPEKEVFLEKPVIASGPGFSTGHVKERNVDDDLADETSQDSDLVEKAEIEDISDVGEMSEEEVEDIPDNDADRDALRKDEKSDKSPSMPGRVSVEKWEGVRVREKEREELPEKGTLESSDASKKHKVSDKESKRGPVSALTVSATAESPTAKVLAESDKATVCEYPVLEGETESLEKTEKGFSGEKPEPAVHEKKPCSPASPKGEVTDKSERESLEVKDTCSSEITPESETEAKPVMTHSAVKDEDKDIEPSKTEMDPQMQRPSEDPDAPQESDSGGGGEPPDPEQSSFLDVAPMMPSEMLTEEEHFTSQKEVPSKAEERSVDVAEAIYSIQAPTESEHVVGKGKTQSITVIASHLEEQPKYDVTDTHVTTETVPSVTDGDFSEPFKLMTPPVSETETEVSDYDGQSRGYDVDFKHDDDKIDEIETGESDVVAAESALLTIDNEKTPTEPTHSKFMSPDYIDVSEVEEADFIEPIAKQEAARVSYEEASVTIAVVEPSKDEPVVTIEQFPTGSPVADRKVEESTVSFHEPVVTMVSSLTEETKVVRPSQIDVSAGFGSLVTPEISIQAASPMVQSPSSDETSLSKSFSGVMVDEYDMEEAQEDANIQQEVPVPAEDPEKAVILRQLSEDKPDRELVKAASTESAQSTISEEALGVHRHLEASSSMEVHRDSQPPSDLDSQSSPHEYDHRDPWRSMEDADGHIDEEVSEDDRPLSPTEYILEPEADGDQEPDGRLGADTSQQIFIEQSIEKQRSPSVSTPPDERPPSPSDFTLVTDETRDVADMYDAERPSGQPQLTPEPCSDDLMQDTVTLTEGVLVEDDETTPDHTTSISTTSPGSASPPKPTSLITTTVPQIERSEETTLVFTPPQTTVAPMLVPDNVYLDSSSSMSSEPAVIQTYEHSGEATMSTLSSDNMEADVMIEREVGKLEAALEPVQQYEDYAAVEECHRLRASSFEDIYTETNLEYEHSSMIPTDGLEIGDRFDTRHADLHLMTQANRSSSFENIETAYKETMKEAASKDEKDIDERERIMIELEAELGRKEKGAEEGEKESPLESMHQAKKGMVVDEEALEKAEEYDNFDVDEPLQSMPMEEPYETPQIEEEEPPYVAVESEEDSDLSSPIHKAAPAPGQLQKYPSPIDLTFESGLDHVGQEDEEETLAAATFPDSDRESLERSQSYEASYDLETFDDIPPRHRHYSSPDEVMHRESLEDIRTTAAAEKDTWDAPAEEDPMSTSSSEMARLEDVQFSKEPAARVPEEDRKSVGTEGTDVEVEEPFSPSATTKDKEQPFGLDLDKYMSSSPMSHSPPEPISPSKERALSEDLSPVYDYSHDPRKMKVALGLSPSEFITEDDEFEQEDEEEDEEEETAEGPTIGMSPTSEEIPSPMEETPPSPQLQTHETHDTDEEQHSSPEAFEPTLPAKEEPVETKGSSLEEAITCSELVTVPSEAPDEAASVLAVDPVVKVRVDPPVAQAAETGAVKEPSPPKTVEFMSFDNMGFSGKERIDWEDSSKEGSDPEMDDVDDDDMPEPKTEEQKIAEPVQEPITELQDTYKPAAESEDVMSDKDVPKQRLSAGRQSISSESASGSEDAGGDLDMSELQQKVGITSVHPPPVPVDITYSDEEPDSKYESSVVDVKQPTEQEGGDVTPKAGSPKRTPESYVSEPHESIEKAYEAQVIDTILDRCSHDFEVSSEIQMEPTSFRIGQIEYQEEEGDKRQPTVQADHPSAARTASSESSSDTMTASAFTSSFMTAPASLDTSDYHTGETSVYEETLSFQRDEQEEFRDQAIDDEPEDVSLDNVPKALDVISASQTQQLHDEQDRMARVTSDASLDRTESASLDSEELEEPYGDQRDEMVEECQIELMPSALPPTFETHSEEEPDLSQAKEDKTESPVMMAEAAARLKYIEIGTPKTVESISSEELIKTSSSSDTSAEPTLLAATYDLDSGAISRVVTDYDISPDTVERTLTVDSQPKAILSSPEDEVFESELGDFRGKLKEPKSEETDDMPLVSFSPTHARDIIIEEPEPEVSLEITEPEQVFEAERPISPFEIVDDSDLEGYDEYMVASLEHQKHEEERKARESQDVDFGVGVGVGISAAAGAAVFAGVATVTSETKDSVTTEQKPEQVVRPSLSFGEQEESPTFEHSSPISSSEPSDFRGPISPFDTPALEPLPDIVQVEEAIAEEPQRELEEQDLEEPDQYIHANGPTEVDFYPEHDIPFDPMQQLEPGVEEPEEADDADNSQQEMAPVAPVAAVAPEPVLEPFVIEQIEAPTRFYEQEIDQAEKPEEEFLFIEPAQPEAAQSVEEREQVPEFQEGITESPMGQSVEEELLEQEIEVSDDDQEHGEEMDPLRPELIMGSDVVEPTYSAHDIDTSSDLMQTSIQSDVQSSIPSHIMESSTPSDVIEPSAPSLQEVAALEDSYSTSESFSMVDIKKEDLAQSSLTSSTEMVKSTGEIEVPTATSDTMTTSTTESFRDQHEYILLSESQQDFMAMSSDDTAYQTGLTETQTGLTASLMESLLDIPEHTDKMMASDQTLYNIEMPTDELSASQTTPKRDMKTSELSSLEEELADAAENVTDQDASPFTSQALEEPQLLDRPPSSGKEALESDAMFTMFSGTVVTEVPPDYADQSMEVDEDYYGSMAGSNTMPSEGDGAYGVEIDTMEEPQLEDGGDSFMECEDDELASLTEDTELDIPTGTDFSPVVLDAQHPGDFTEYADPERERHSEFELRPDPTDIDRPQSPIPDWDDEQRMDVDQGDISPVRQEEIEDQRMSVSPAREDDDLKVHASVFVQSVMVEAQATVQSGEVDISEPVVQEPMEEREEEDMSGSDTDYMEPVSRKPVKELDDKKDEGHSSSSGDVESDDDLPPPPSPPHVLHQFLPDDATEKVPQSPEEFELAMPTEEAPKPPHDESSDQASDDIPAIMITQHLHKETDEGDYPTSYAPAHIAEEEEEEEEDDFVKHPIRKPVKPLGEFDAMFGDSAEVQVKVKFDDDASPLSPDTDSFLGRGRDLDSPKETRAGVVSSESEEDFTLDSPDNDVHVVRVEEMSQGRVEKPLPVLPEESPSKEKYEEDLMREEIMKEKERQARQDDSTEQLAAAVVHGVIEAVRSDSESFLGLKQTTRVSGLRTEGFEVAFGDSEETYESQDSALLEEDMPVVGDITPEINEGESSESQPSTVEPSVQDIQSKSLKIAGQFTIHSAEDKGEATPELESAEDEASEMSLSGEGQVSVSSDMSSSGEGQVSVISLDTALKQREIVDLQSPEDLGDSSSVDSFQTVIANQPDSREFLEDRLIEVASMTSSFHSDMQSSFHEDLPEAPIAIDVRDREPDASKLSSSSSGEMFDLEAAMLSFAASPPDNEQYEVLHLMSGLEYPRMPRQLEVVKEEPESDQKDSSGETTSSSSERIGVVTTDSSSERIYSSPDIPVPSPDIHGGRFFHRNNEKERDDISVSSSLLEFERLEMEVGDKTSLDSFRVDLDSRSPIYGRSLEKDDVSVSSSLAEFENLEGAMGQSDSMEKVMVTPDSKSSVDNASVSSLNEFERLEQDFIGESDSEKKRRRSSSSDSNNEFPLDKTSVKSSTSSLTEFERLEQEMYINGDLQIEAQKVVTLLESGALVPERRTESDMSLSEGASQPEVFISQEQLVEPEDLPRDEGSSDDQVVPVTPKKEEDMDRDSLGDVEEGIDRIIQEASRNVETFAVPTEAVLVSRTLQEAIRTASCESRTCAGLVDYGVAEDGTEADDDSLDGQEDDEEFKLDQAAAPPIPMIIPSLVPAEHTTHEIDLDSLQGDSESLSKSGALDSDSLQDQDSVMQISAESFEMDPHGPTMSSSAEGDRMLKSCDSGAGAMDRSADSLELDRATAAPIMLRPTEGQMAYSGEGLMERSADSLEGELAMPQSESKDSFDRDSLHDEEGEIMGASGEWPGELDPPRHHRHTSLMEMSMESGAWSQSSSLFSQDTMKSSASEAYKDIMRMSVDSPEYDKQTIIDMSEQGSERYTRIESVQEEMELRHAHFEQTETEVTKTVIDSEGNVHTTQTFERRCIDDDENRHVIGYQEEHEQMDVDSDWHKKHMYRSAGFEPKVGPVTLSMGAGSPRPTTCQTTTHITVESSPPVAIPCAAPQYPSAQSSPSSESSHSENCYCGPDYATSMASGQRPDQPDRPLASREHTFNAPASFTEGAMADTPDPELLKRIESIDDDEMREVDSSEHLEFLRQGIPAQYAQQSGPAFVFPTDDSDMEEDMDQAEGYPHHHSVAGQVVSTEGELDEAAGGDDVQTTRSDERHLAGDEKTGSQKDDYQGRQGGGFSDGGHTH